MKYHYLLFAVSVLTSVSSSYGSQVITTSFGKTATLPCQIVNQASDLQFLYWRKDGTTIYSRTSFGEHTNGKYSVIDTASLVIHDVMESDAGNYSCIVARRSLVTEESDIMQLYVIDVSVSHCKDTGQEEVDGCSCYINGSSITSLGCSASGFPHPPVVTWEEDIIIYISSSVDLTRISENITLTCKARDENLKGVVANTTVCVYYTPEVPSTSGSPVETITTYRYYQARVAAIVVSIILILVLLTLLILICLAAAYRRKKGKAFHFLTCTVATSMSKGSSLEDLPTSQPRMSTISEVDFSTEDCNRDFPKTIEETYKLPISGMNSSGYGSECVDVLKDSWKNSKGSSLEDLPTSQPRMSTISEFDFFSEDCNRDFHPLVGLVLLDDLSYVPEETKESIKAAVVALVVEPHKIHQSHMDPIVTIHTSFIDMNETLQRSVKTGDLGGPGAALVDKVLQDVDKIIDERDECEILITKPDFQEVTDKSQIPDYQGKTVIHQSSDSDPVVHTRQEENEIPDTPSTEKLLGDKIPK